ncbi:hypothetical protein D3C79_926380 [compost metagenome]
MPVTVRVMRTAHGVIFLFIRQQPGHRINNFSHVGADQADRTRIHRFRPFGRVTHYQHRFTQ